MAHFITQQESDFLFQMEKFPESNELYSFPVSGTKIVIPFTSSDKHESFLFDIYRSSIKLTKVTYQNRVRKSFILRRLDIDGPSHLNPNVENVPLDFLAQYNSKEIDCPHLHIYVEGFNNKWAVPVSLFFSIDGKDIYDAMFDFFKYCNVKRIPIIEKGLLI